MNYEGSDFSLQQVGIRRHEDPFLGEHTNLKSTSTPQTFGKQAFDKQHTLKHKHPRWFPWNTMDVRGANTFPLHNRLPNLFVVAMTILWGFLDNFPFLWNK